MPKSSSKESSERTEKEREEYNLYQKWRKTEEKKKVDSYTGIEIEEIPEEDRELVELIRKYGYGIGSGLTPFEEVLKFIKENGRIPKYTKKKKSERTEKESEEDKLYQKWKKTEEKKKVDSYIGKRIEEIPEEDRGLVELIRKYGYMGKARTSKEIAEATIVSLKDIELADKEDKALQELVEKNKTQKKEEQK